MRNPAIIFTPRKMPRHRRGPLWFLLALLLLAPPASANTPDPNETVDVTTNSWAPNPALVQQVITSGASGSDNSIPKPQDEDTVRPHWTWTTVQIYASPMGASGSFTPYTGNSVVEWPNGDDTQPNTDFTGQFWDAGFYIVEVVASVRYHDDTTNTDIATHYGYGYLGGTASDLSTGTNPNPTPAISGSGVNAEAVTGGGGGTGGKGGKGIPVTSVKFSSSAVTLGLYSVHSTTATVTATVTPASAVGEITFSVVSVADGTANGEATVVTTPPTAGQDPGTINLTLTAQSPTPGPLTSPAGPASNYKNGGDAQLVPIVNGEPYSSAATKILVLEPAEIVQPKPGKLIIGTVTGYDILVSKASRPSDPTVPDNMVWEATAYEMKFTIHVADQFKNALDPLFKDTPVEETVTTNTGTGNQSINEILTGSGTYDDLAGFFVPNGHQLLVDPKVDTHSAHV